MKFRNILTILIILTAINISNAAVQAPIKPTTPAQTTQAPVQNVSSLELVANPNKYLNKNIIIDGKFDKFTTLGLDYKKALKDSTVYIGFLIQRDDVKDHNIPLSELKLFLKRDYAEKFIDLNTGDKISISGTVFSNALGDAWVDVKTIQVLEKAPKNNQN